MDLREGTGGVLREARQRRGIARSVAAADLAVPEHFLADLEEGRLEPFGPVLHATAYLRVYARYLGLDEDQLLESVTSGPAVPPAQGEVGSRPRRLLLIVALTLVGIGALVAVVTVLMLDPEGDTLTLEALIAREPASWRVAGEDDTAVHTHALPTG